ncbi:MAG: glutamate--tRNA ligase [archaeon YNP-LCB-003-016]|uniref:glutamate--tRNA ligase n=1 Tax=Candidatus Culexarchaeum yellowstonense TaxID=2928963 RepID=UPI0026F0A878|nr:glutamate--tRNA ligase [Candidatus Culexarchaeum yellowstonense]MCR6690941.1 glutamate--tRNA ligase [Candidatus Culexarchaeum yellowstonense]
MLEIDEFIESIIFKYALLNAYKHDGKAQVNAVLSKIFSELPQYRSLAKTLLPHVERIVNEVNSMTIELQKKLLEERWPGLIKESKAVEEEKKLPPLPNADKVPIVKTRFAPNPDAPLHLGSARPIILSYEYAKMYNGKFILRFEDTDPKTKRPVLEFYDMIKDDIVWLGAKWDELYIQSDRMDIYYDLARKLMEMGYAYVCTCPAEVFKKYKTSSKECPCRSRSVEENIELWEKMINHSFKEGDAVVRIKTDMSHPNPSVRDWVAFRIIDVKQWPHPRTGDKYCVWPTYNFACAIDDHLMGVTHILRGREHEVNTIKQKYIFNYFGWVYPEAIHFGRMKLSGWVLSKSKIAEGIKRGIYKSWDDPRLGTLAALRRRGFRPEAIREIIFSVGIKSTSASISLENLYSINRRILEPVANRFFFIASPQFKLNVHGVLSKIEAKIPLHPNYIERGYRILSVTPVNNTITVYIQASDAHSMKIDETYRLMGLLNFKVTNIDYTSNMVDSVFLGVETLKFKGEQKIIHWLPLEGNANATIVMPDASETKGLCDYQCLNLKIGEVIQFMRFGFVRVDSINKDSAELTFYYTHP